MPDPTGLRPLRTTSLVIVILILLIVFWPTDSTRLQDESPKTPQSEEKTVTQNTRAERSNSTRTIRQKSKKNEEEGAVDPYEDWELSKILTHFMVPPDEFRAGSINNSISKLKEIYSKYSGHKLEVTLNAPVHPNKAISFQHDNISFRTLLGMVAGLSGYSVEVTDREVIFSTINPSSIRSTIPLGLSEGELTELLNSPEKTRDYLISLGFHSPEVYGFPNDPKELNNLIASLEEIRLDSENIARKVRVQNKLISFQPGFEFEATDMTDSELQLAIREWSQMKGVDILTAPSIVAMPGQDATIEIGKEVIYPDPQQADQFITEFVGLRMSTQPILAGLDQIQMGGAITFSSVDTENPLHYTEDSFQSEITETEISLYEGSHVLVPIIGEDGVTTIQVISSQRIDASGKAFWPPEPE